MKKRAPAEGATAEGATAEGAPAGGTRCGGSLGSLKRRNEPRAVIILPLTSTKVKCLETHQN